MGFIRFILEKKHPDSGKNEGLFALAYQLRDCGDVAEGDRQDLTEALKWFDLNLPIPDRFNRSRSKGYYRRATRGIAWLRDTSRECISRMYCLKRLLETHDHQVSVIHETRIGYIVYEDDHQVVAEPFADTQTDSHG